MLQRIVGPEPVLLRRFPLILPRNDNPIPRAIVRQKCLGSLLPLFFPAAGLDLLQSRPVEVQQRKDLAGIARRSPGGQADEKAQKAECLPQDTHQRSTTFLQSSVTMSGRASGERKWKWTLERLTLLACRI